MVQEKSPCETRLIKFCHLGKNHEKANLGHITKRENQTWAEMKYVKTFLQSYVLQNKQIFLSLSFVFEGDI